MMNKYRVYYRKENTHQNAIVEASNIVSAINKTLKHVLISVNDVVDVRQVSRIHKDMWAKQKFIK